MCVGVETNKRAVGRRIYAACEGGLRVRIVQLRSGEEEGLPPLGKTKT